MTIDSGRSLSIRKLSYLSWLITPCCGWTDCQEWICFYKHPVSVLHLTDVLGMSFSCLDLLCLKKKLKTFLLIMRVFFLILSQKCCLWPACMKHLFFYGYLKLFSLVLMSDETTRVTIASTLFCRFMG